MIRIINLSKDYSRGFIPQKILALDEVNLQVNKGEIFGYLGPNGAGKTTTIKILLNLIFPSGGEAFINGKSVKETRTREDIGFLPDHPYFYDYLSAWEFLDYCGTLSLMNKKNRKERLNYLLHLVGLEKDKKLQLRKFSRGMLQRLGIAQALINNPDVLILDEPLSGLDPFGTREFKEIIRRQKKEGKTIFFSSHILADAEDLCDRIGILVKGKLKYTGELEKILSEHIEFIEITAKIRDSKALEGKSNLTIEYVKEDLIKIRLDDENDVSAITDTIIRLGGKIQTIVPKRKNLEDIFIAEAQSA